ncbi:hypothetical protein DFJ74DRAFT_695887 [Hyaloraphidium curvatum]|nr:hypothetical protein DFJ74DRAFT_695887 [Hyaloraphidium curvatum]
MAANGTPNGAPAADAPVEMSQIAAQTPAAATPETSPAHAHFAEPPRPQRPGLAFQEPVQPAKPQLVVPPEPVPHVNGAAVAPAEAPEAKAAAEAAKEKAKALDITEHLMTPEEVAAKYSTAINLTTPAQSPGLTTAEATKRLVEYGPNALTPPKKRHPILRYLDFLSGLFNVLLIGAGVLSYIVYAVDPANNFQNVYTGAILFAVAFINAFVEYIQEAKSQAALESFKNLIPSKAMAMRDGRLETIGAADLVLGDVVLVKMGDKTPADVLLFWCSDMKVDNSSLTGESEPQDRKINNKQENPLEATNLAFNGSLVVNGEGYGIVVRTGDKTVIGQIASLTNNEKKGQSPMSHEIETFVYKIAALAGIFGITFFLIGLLGKKMGISFSLNFAIGILVAFVPQGLPSTVTMLLSIAAKRMAQKQVLVKDLQGVETLGALTLLATDKTGTLTKNQMTVTYVWVGCRLYTTEINNNRDDTAFLDNDAPGVMGALYLFALCSKARFDRTDVPIKDRGVIADATEAGLYRCASQRLGDFDSLATKYPKVFEVPFNSTNKWAMTVNKLPHAKGPLTLMMKGAPERVLKLCTRIFDAEGGVRPMTDADRATFEEIYRFMASKGHRVLAFATDELDGDKYPENFAFSRDPQNYTTDDLVFQGLVSLEDPPKHGVREAVGKIRQAGIQVVMVTGDHPLTAGAIAQKINLMVGETKEMVAERTGRPVSDITEDEYDAVVIHGERVDGLTDDEWDRIFEHDEIIFARTSPKNKLQIVKRAQSYGHIVGVTGDGVNDSPALKKADLGIAMNISGSDVSKEAAAMILIDDNFASTVHGIEEGRVIFQNVRKSIRFVMSHIAPEVWTALLFVIVPIPLPLQAIQILWIDLGYEIFLGLSIAFDPPESKGAVMTLQPRKPVTGESVQLLREKKAWEASRHPKRVDPETGAIDRSRENWFERTAGNISDLFTAQYWKFAFTKTEEEVLVDNELLSYSLLEIGSLETIGCLIAFFWALWYSYQITPADAQSMASANMYFFANSPPYTTSTGRTLNASEQMDAQSQGQSAYFFGIFFLQCYNLFMVKARIHLPFGKFMVANKWNFIMALLGLCLAVFVVYTPPLNIAFLFSWQLSPLIWTAPIAFGIVLIVYVSLRVLALRKIDPVKYADAPEGLKMYATRYSTRSSISVPTFRRRSSIAPSVMAANAAASKA